MVSEYERLMKKARKLVNKLQENITTGKTQIKENYGQKEINKFINQFLDNSNLSYSAKESIKLVLYEVSSIY